MKFIKQGKEFTHRNSADLVASSESIKILAENITKFGSKWDVHLPVFLTPPSLARVMWLDEVYRLALDVPGNLVEFGSQFGASFGTFLNLKLIHEPWNASRKILSFSTFDEGFVSIDKKDGDDIGMGDYGTHSSWLESLQQLLLIHERKSPLGEGANYKIFPGDASITFKKWLDENPHAIFSHAHFDMDVYKPTKDTLELCFERMPKGAVLIFDELNCPSFPGETAAVQEVLGIKNLSLRKSKLQPYSCYCIVGE